MWNQCFSTILVYLIWDQVPVEIYGTSLSNSTGHPLWGLPERSQSLIGDVDPRVLDHFCALHFGSDSRRDCWDLIIIFNWSSISRTIVREIIIVITLSKPRLALVDLQYILIAIANFLCCYHLCAISAFILTYIHREEGYDQTPNLAAAHINIVMKALKVENWMTGIHLKKMYIKITERKISKRFER